MLRVALAAALAAAPPPAALAADPAARTPSQRAHVEKIFRSDYPLEGSASFAAALFHWVDSLAGTSGGKTISLYREEYYTTFGSFGDAGKSALGAFRGARLGHAARNGFRGTERGAPSMLGVFLEADDVDSALRLLESQTSPDEREALRSSLAHFAPLYRRLWKDGKVPRAFLEQAKRDPARGDLEKLLAAMARFFSVDPRREPPPRIVFVPVPSGGGTHAEAVGRSLLIEIRDWERLLDESPPIVHENAHFLWYRMNETRVERLAAAARAMPGGDREWRLFHEALPTALGQGVAARKFLKDGWSMAAGWYHFDDVDECAKRIYPLVQRAMDEGGVLDEAFIKKLVERSRGPAAASPAGIIPR